MKIYTELLDRIRAEIDREMDLATHYGQRIVEQDQRLRAAAVAEQQAQRALTIAGGRPRRNATGSGLEGERERGAEHRDQARAEQAAGRFAVVEQMRQLAGRATDAGADVNRAIAQYATATAGRGDLSGHEQALDLATAARQREGGCLASLEQQRAFHGRRCGQLRQTLHEAEQWLASQAPAWGRAA